MIISNDAKNMREKKPSIFEQDLLILLEKAHASTSLTIEEIIGDLAGKGKLLILIVLSIPFCQPLQIPGVAIPFGIIIAFIGLRMAFGKQIWLPKKLLSKRIAAKTVRKTGEKALKIMIKCKRFIHPRMMWLAKSRTMQIINGLIIGFLGIFLALPLPIPLSNITAGWGIFLLAVGLLEDDGVILLVAYFATIVTCIILFSILFSIELFFHKWLHR